MTHHAREDVVTGLTRDHREVEGMFGQLEASGMDPQKRREIADDVIIELVRHSVAEERYLYPACPRRCPTATASPTRSSRTTPRPSRR